MAAPVSRPTSPRLADQEGVTLSVLALQPSALASERTHADTRVPRRGNSLPGKRSGLWGWSRFFDSAQVLSRAPPGSLPESGVTTKTSQQFTYFPFLDKRMAQRKLRDDLITISPTLSLSSSVSPSETDSDRIR